MPPVRALPLSSPTNGETMDPRVRFALGAASELTGFALIGFVLWLLWPPLPLVLLGALLIYIPNRK